MSIAIDVQREAALEFSDEPASDTATPITKSEAKLNTRRQYQHIRDRMDKAPERVKQIANEELASKHLLHAHVSDMILNRHDDAMIDRLAKRFGCSYEEAHLVIDYFVLVRMMSSDSVGIGTLQL